MTDSIEIESDLVIEEFGVLSFDESEEDEFQTPKISILDLPEELLIHILSYISLYELYHNVAPVSKMFCRLTRDPGVRRTIFINNKAPSEFAEKFVGDALHLTSLTLKNRDDANRLLAAALSHCCKLSHLEARFCQPLTEASLTRLSGFVSNLQFFSLEGTGVCASEPFNDVWRHLFASTAKLRHLNLFGCRFLESEDLETIGKICTGLEYLNLEEVTHLCIPSLASLILARKDTLKTLLLDGEYVTDDFFRHLGKCRKLECLGIAFADSISSQGMEAISELSRLTSLKLMRAKDLPPIEFITTFSSPKMERLTSLNLSECCLLDDNSLAAIANTCRLLRELILNWCWELTDKGVEEVLLYCHRLEELSLVGVVRITESILVDVGIVLPELRLLNLEQCPNIDDANLVEIVRKGRSNLKFVNYWGESLMRCTTNPFFPFSMEEEDEDGGSSA